MSNESRSMAHQIGSLAARLDKLEAKVAGATRQASGKNKHVVSAHACSLPKTPERQFDAKVSPHRERLIRYIDRKWVNGTKLRYYFWDRGSFAGAEDQKSMVREGFDVWTQVGIGIQFEEVSDISDAEIRIGFLQDGTSWSYVGRDVIDIPGQYERTMNFGWDLTRDPRGVDTPVHEIGHTLGFPHEHQNPYSGIVWDEEAVYAYFGGPPNYWDPDAIEHNVLRKLSVSEVEGSDWDPHSVMHYGFGPGLIVQPEEYQDGLTPDLGLSQTDIDEVRRFYPPIGNQHPTLRPWSLQLLSLQPAEQANYTINPDYTDDYTIQTLGRSDTVMVLFEEIDGELRYLDGDDDSGYDRNARISVQLRRGRRYVLRIRLYLNYASGDTAVLML